MKQGHAQVVTEFGESMARLHLDAPSITTLLRAEQSGHGAPALHLACKSGQTATVNAFTQLIDQFKDTLNETQKQGLIDSIHNGESALDVARGSGHEAVCIALESSRKRHCPTRATDT
jgi:hypothetical protein